ncbi:MAG: hypothetical protein HOW71_37320 [Nonomuraea sp.]|nr:hypothetical protein [Nonomuraea sp.]NUP67832.1 hypothetical protein [Nonomuraea sp.]NUS03870.1 hypothetical protein [Nonomuraea sp.]NUT12425.1 hypothetical protein [Nonomuraea sp.]
MRWTAMLLGSALLGSLLAAAPVPAAAALRADPPQVAIDGLTPGSYSGTCAAPVTYNVAGHVELPAGPAAEVVYTWQLDDRQLRSATLSFPESTQPRSQTVAATWNYGTADAGSHRVRLTAQGGVAEQGFTFACGPASPPAYVTFHAMLTPRFAGECTGSVGLRAEATVVADRDTEIQYRVVVDGVPGWPRSQQLRGGVKTHIGDLWYNSARSSGDGRVRVEILNHNKPVKEEAYFWRCRAVPSPVPYVRISGITPMAYYGDCSEDPYVTAHGTFTAPVGTQISYRWLMSGVPLEYRVLTVPESGFLNVQASWWYQKTKQSGNLTLEVLNNNKPALTSTLAVTCQATP